MSSLFKTPKVPPIPPPPPPEPPEAVVPLPDPDDPLAKARRRRTVAQRGSGRVSTMLSEGQERLGG